MGKLTAIDHPLIQAKMTMLRGAGTGNKEFRALMEEISTLIFYEAARDAPLVDTEAETPQRKTTCKTLGVKFAIVPILRAGMGMVNGVMNLTPMINAGHIGMYREPGTLQPAEYYHKLPADCAERVTFLADPMLATGGTASAATEFLKATS